MTNNTGETIRKYWPIVVTVLALTVTAADANTRLITLKDRVDYIYTNGPPSQADRLARIETRQEEAAKSLERMQQQLDQIQARQEEIYSVSPHARSQLKRL